MKTKERITQVKLERPCAHTEELYAKVCGTYDCNGEWMPCKGTTFDVFWIDAKLAKKGKLVRDEDGFVWTVAEVYGSKDVGDLDMQRKAWSEFATKLGFKKNR